MQSERAVGLVGGGATGEFRSGGAEERGINTAGWWRRAVDPWCGGGKGKGEGVGSAATRPEGGCVRACLPTPLPGADRGHPRAARGLVGKVDRARCRAAETLVIRAGQCHAAWFYCTAREA